MDKHVRQALEAQSNMFTNITTKETRTFQPPVKVVKPALIRFFTKRNNILCIVDKKLLKLLEIVDDALELGDYSINLFNEGLITGWGSNVDSNSSEAAQEAKDIIISNFQESDPGKYRYTCWSTAEMTMTPASFLKVQKAIAKAATDIYYELEEEVARWSLVEDTDGDVYKEV